MSDKYDKAGSFRGVRKGKITIGAAAAVAAAVLLAACSSGSDGQAADARARTTTSPVAGHLPSTTTPATTTTASPTTSPPSATPSVSSPATSSIHIRLLNRDGATYGVGMPVIAYFSKAITDAAPLQRATTVTVDGKPMRGGWYFENSRAGNGPLEAHFRLATYWPAHAHVRVDIAAKGVSAGKGKVFDDDIFSDFRTGARTISRVDDRRHTITVVSDGKKFGTFPVSLGADGSPTQRGTKVIMEQGPDIRMEGDGLSGHYTDPHVYWTQRLTYEGEYLHAAPWNDPAENGGSGNIGSGNSSNGCTNLTTSDARKLFKLMRVGDVVRYPDTDGRRMQLGDGYGDWNLTWAHWLTGGLVPTS